MLKVPSEIQEIVKNLPSIDEDSFKYFELSQHYNFSINFIEDQADIPDHSHEQTVFNIVLLGKISVKADDQTVTYSKGDLLHIPANKKHSVKAHTKVVLLEIWKK